MQYPAKTLVRTLPAKLLLTAGALALVAATTGCAVPVADGYGYDYPPSYPPATYYDPQPAPGVVYGAPPVVLGGQVWIDSRDRRTPPRRHEDWRERGWQGNDRNARPGHDNRGSWQPPQRPPRAEPQRPPRVEHERPPAARNPGQFWDSDRSRGDHRERGPRRKSNGEDFAS